MEGGSEHFFSSLKNLNQFQGEEIAVILETAEDGTPRIIATMVPQDGNTFTLEEKKIIYLQQALEEPDIDKGKDIFEQYMNQCHEEFIQEQKLGNPKA
jgi:ribosome maturation factor RimP